MFEVGLVSEGGMLFAILLGLTREEERICTSLVSKTTAYQFIELGFVSLFVNHIATAYYGMTF